MGFSPSGAHCRLKGDAVCSRAPAPPPRKILCQIIRKVTANLHNIWREILHDMWRISQGAEGFLPK